MVKENRYSSWLVASDIDGTLNNKRRKLPGRNREAISSFIRKGGIFTLASSRNPESMSKHYRGLELTTPAVVATGVGIYDFQKDEYVDFMSLSDKSLEKICEIRKSYPTLDAVIVARDMLYVTGAGFWSLFYVLADNLTNKWIPDIRKVPKNEWGKVMFMGPPWRIRDIRRKFEAVPDKEFDIIDTSVFSLEILPEGVNKGSAVLRLADLLGIDRRHTAGIGDYYNDVDMLKSVGVSACCGQAPSKMKRLAEYVACHCDKGAVADFLEYLIDQKINK